MKIRLKTARTIMGKKYKKDDVVDIHESLASIYIKHGFATKSLSDKTTKKQSNFTKKSK